MKLRNKIITVLSLSTIGGFTPAVVSSCSCSESFNVVYGDSLNCKEKDNKAIRYHSIDEIKNTIKSHVPMPQEEMEIIVWNASNVQQEFYWDLAYSALQKNIEFILIWKFKEDTYKKQLDVGNFNGIEFQTLQYVWNSENQKYEIVTNNNQVLVESYMYSLVKK